MWPSGHGNTQHTVYALLAWQCRAPRLVFVFPSGLRRHTRVAVGNLWAALHLDIDTLGAPGRVRGVLFCGLVLPARLLDVIVC